MKQYTIQQEILMVIDSILSKKQWSECIAQMTGRQMPLIEKLKYACTKNLLAKLLPEIIGDGSSKPPVSIWPVQRKNNLLQIRIGQSTVAFDKQHSINTECFLQHLVYN